MVSDDEDSNQGEPEDGREAIQHELFDRNSDDGDRSNDSDAMDDGRPSSVGASAPPPLATNYDDDSEDDSGMSWLS